MRTTKLNYFTKIYSLSRLASFQSNHPASYISILLQFLWCNNQFVFVRNVAQIESKSVGRSDNICIINSMAASAIRD